MNARNDQINAFLARTDWAEADRSPIKGDASTRRYERLSLDARKALLMDAPQSGESPAAPKGADIKTRRDLGYNAVARLAGARMESFAALAKALTQRGFSAPEIYAADLAQGFLILEDFGSSVFAQIIQDAPAREDELYTLAVDCLAEIYRASFPQEMGFEDYVWRVEDYDTHALLAEAELALDWYAPDLGVTLSPKARAEWTEIWQALFEHLSNHAPGLALRDFHAENIFYLSEREGAARIGLIDFQDALFTHPSYDLMSLLQDIRRDVDEALHAPLKRRFFDQAGLTDYASFERAYAVMGAQRNAKLLGFPVRADQQFGKPQYRALLPRIRRHMRTNLAHPDLMPIKQWFETHLPQIWDDAL